MSIYFGSTELAAIKVGNQDVVKVCVGSVEVWSAEVAYGDPDTATFKSTVGTEDGYVEGGGFNNAQNDIDVGSGVSMFLRMVMPTGLVPGSIIDAATFDLGFRLTNTDTPVIRITAYDADDAVAPTNATEANAQLAALTTAFVDWNLPVTAPLEHLDSPDFKAVLQEIVNRGGFAEGNGVVFYLVHQSGGEKEIYSRTITTTAHHPLITIDWRPPA